jgi:glycosyltransferase involved in cell wall biosynthesis
VVVHQLAKHMSTRGHDVHVIYTRPVDQTEVAPEYAVSWVPHHERITANAVPVAMEAARLSRSAPFDIYHTSGAEGAMLGALVGRKAPVVYTEHYGSLPRPPTVEWVRAPVRAFEQLYGYRFFYVTRHAARRAAQVVVPSHFGAAQVCSAYDIPPGRISVIPWGVDLGLFRRRPEPSALGSAPVKMVYVGRVERAKGLDVLLEAFALVVARAPAANLTLIGRGDLECYRARARSLGIASRVEFKGQLSRVECAETFRQSHVCVLPSLFESFGLVLLEAMASGLAVIASKVGGVPEIVTHEQTGILVPPGQPDELATAMIRLIDDAECRSRLSEAGYKQVTEDVRFTWDACVDAHCDLYENLLWARH